MEIDSTLITRLIRTDDVQGLRRVKTMLSRVSKDAKLVCDAAERIQYPTRVHLCTVHKRIERLHRRVLDSLRKKKTYRKKSTQTLSSGRSRT